MNAAAPRTFSDLQAFAATANAYRQIRAERPLVPAITVKQFLDDPDICRNIDQYVCSHEWSYTGSAYGGDDDSYHGEGRCYCSYCGLDGDA